MKVVLIVEGNKDADQIAKAFPDNDNVQTVVTGGTKFNNKVITEIQEIMQDDDVSVYVFSDPDTAGNQLYEMIVSVFPELPRIEADTKECSYFTGKKFKMGIEYASYRYLRKVIYPMLGLEYVEEDIDFWGEIS